MTHSLVDIDDTTLERFCSHLTGWGSSENTVRAYRADLGPLLADHPEVRPETFSDTAACWLTDNRDKWQASTVNRKLAAFNKFADWLGVPGLADYRRPRVTQRVHEGIDIEAVHEVLDRLTLPVGLHLTAPAVRNAYAMVSLCGASGLRIGEAFSVDWDSFGKPSGDTVPLRVEGKGAKERTVPYPFKHYNHLMGYSRPHFHDLPNVEQARDLVTRVFGQCGFEKVESHQLRHAFATAAFDHSQDILAVSRLLGHASPDTTMRYIQTKYETTAGIVGGIA